GLTKNEKGADGALSSSMHRRGSALRRTAEQSRDLGLLRLDGRLAVGRRFLRSRRLRRFVRLGEEGVSRLLARCGIRTARARRIAVTGVGIARTAVAFAASAPFVAATAIGRETLARAAYHHALQLGRHELLLGQFLDVLQQARVLLGVERDCIALGTGAAGTADAV